MAISHFIQPHPGSSRPECPVQSYASVHSTLVVQSTSDKALVSRTLRLLEERRLVALAAQGNTPRKKILVSITPEGRALHDRVIPIARRNQAAALRVLTPEERRVMYGALHKLHDHCFRRKDDTAS